MRTSFSADRKAHSQNFFPFTLNPVSLICTHFDLLARFCMAMYSDLQSSPTLISASLIAFTLIWDRCWSLRIPVPSLWVPGDCILAWWYISGDNYPYHLYEDNPCAGTSLMISSSCNCTHQVRILLPLHSVETEWRIWFSSPSVRVFQVNAYIQCISPLSHGWSHTVLHVCVLLPYGLVVYLSFQRDLWS